MEEYISFLPQNTRSEKKFFLGQIFMNIIHSGGGKSRQRKQENTGGKPAGIYLKVNYRNTRTRCEI